MPKFTTKRDKTTTIHGSHACGELEIRGCFTLQGPQPINDEGGCPEWVADMLDSNPDINQIAVSSKKSSVVWSRIPDQLKDGG